MATFNSTGTVVTIKNKKGDISVSVERFVKDGTKRVFFAPIVNGLRINRTMFARLYDAERLAKQYIQFKEKQTA